MQPITDIEQSDAILSSEIAVIFKHSTRCHVSAFAFREVTNFARHHPNVPVYIIQVIEQKILVHHINERTNVKHESPQVIVIRNGKVIWNDSHEGVTEEAIAGHLSFT